VLFDGVCNLCSGTVQWILRRDRRARFRFASLQSAAARDALQRAGVTGQLPDSMVVIARGRVRVRGDAVLAITRELGLPWSLAAVGRIVPRPLRDLMYAFVANRRYRWFGRREACWVPTPALRARFLDGGEGQASGD
jgi:predicted DCC family thiol-disulfide oxidoreductase YuxK